MRILHILVQLPNLIAAIWALDIISKDIGMPSNFSYKSVSSTLQDQADAEVWIIFLFLQTGFNQLALNVILHVCFLVNFSPIVSYKLISLTISSF